MSKSFEGSHQQVRELPARATALDITKLLTGTDVPPAVWTQHASGMLLEQVSAQHKITSQGKQKTNKHSPRQREAVKLHQKPSTMETTGMQRGNWPHFHHRAGQH